MVHSHTVHLPLGALLIWKCTMCGTGGLTPSLAALAAQVERGVASVADVDTAMRLGASRPMGPLLVGFISPMHLPYISVCVCAGASHPMGPLQLADYVGLDTLASILKGGSHGHPRRTATPCTFPSVHC